MTVFLCNPVYSSVRPNYWPSEEKVCMDMRNMMCQLNGAWSYVQLTLVLSAGTGAVCIRAPYQSRVDLAELCTISQNCIRHYVETSAANWNGSAQTSQWWNQTPISPFCSYCGLICATPTWFCFTPLQGTREQWLYVFYISAAIYLVGAVLYLLLGSGVEQEWNKPSYRFKRTAEREALLDDNDEKDSFFT